MNDSLSERFRALQHAPEPLILVNVWDVASATTVAAQPGCEAPATASWAIAAAHGYPDHEEISVDLMLAAIERIAAATDLPVTADLEGGYGDVAATVSRALDAGVVGCNLEDECRPLEESVERVRAAAQTGMVVNARTDLFVRSRDHASVLDEAIERGRAYLGAGAECFFAIGVVDPGIIERLVAEVGAVSVFATPKSPPIPELARLGVRRISFGPGPLGIATAALGRAANRLLSGGVYPEDLGHRP